MNAVDKAILDNIGRFILISPGQILYTSVGVSAINIFYQRMINILAVLGPPQTYGFGHRRIGKDLKMVNK
jgi:hypothetical protein